MPNPSGTQRPCLSNCREYAAGVFVLIDYRHPYCCDACNGVSEVPYCLVQRNRVAAWIMVPLRLDRVTVMLTSLARFSSIFTCSHTMSFTLSSISSFPRPANTPPQGTPQWCDLVSRCRPWRSKSRPVNFACPSSIQTRSPTCARATDP